MGIRDELSRMKFGMLPSQWGLEPAEERLETFWNRARIRAKLDPLGTVIAPDDMTAFRPPAFAGPDADAFAARVLGSGGGELATAKAELGDGVELPRVGELAILVDASETPVALLRTCEVVDAGDSVVERFEVLYRAGD